MAVIHPVTYLRLKTETGVRVRNISIGCVWLLCSFTLGLLISYSQDLPSMPFFLFFAFGMFVTSFCTLSVLRALIRPGPGEVGGDRTGSLDLHVLFFGDLQHCFYIKLHLSLFPKGLQRHSAPVKWDQVICIVFTCIKTADSSRLTDHCG